MFIKCFEHKNGDLLLIGEESKRPYVLIKIFKYIHVRCYCLQASRTAETLKFHIKDCFKIKGKQGIKIPKKVNTLD